MPLHLKIVTPERLVVDEEVDEVVAPGDLGEFGVLPGHTPFITTLLPGELRYKKAGAETKFIVWEGIAEVRDDNVNVLTRNVEDPSSVDVQSAEREIESIVEELSRLDGDPEKFKELNRRLKLAQARAGSRE